MPVQYGKFELPNKLKIDESTRRSTFARFIAEPFERGFGHTIGNSLRRIMLSSLEAPAIVSVKLEGVAHEFMAVEGVIEDIDDPLMMHRVRVRVFAFHDNDKNKIPTNCLPWFPPLFAFNSSQSSIPNVGDWVLVHFPDPESAQYGYVMGTIPGIVSEEEVPELVVTAKRPEKPAGDPAGVLGYPSTVPAGRMVIKDTGVDRTNQELVHVCDITIETNRFVSGIKREFGLVLAALKELIAKALQAMGFGDPSGLITKFVELAKDIASQIKKVTDFLKEVNETIAGYLKIVRQIRAIIAYILSLPARLLAEFQQCLSNLYKSLFALGK